SRPRVCVVICRGFTPYLISGRKLFPGGSGMPRYTCVLVAIFTLLAAPCADAGVLLTFFPASSYNANTATMDTTLGITGYTIVTFESTSLIPGLSINLSGGVPNTTWTTLPALFNGNVCPGVADNQFWYGADSVINTTTNQISNCSGPPNIATFMAFQYAPGATSIGLGLSNFQSTTSPVFAITQHELFVNGTDMGVLESLAGPNWTPGLVR